MKYDCAMIMDLMPLYADEVCSEKSKQAVEAHLLLCENCRCALEHMRADIPQGSAPAFSEQDVLRRTSWNISKRAILSAAGVTAIVLYWLVYLWQDALSEVGDYRFITYGFHEIYGIGYLLVPVLTVIWLVVLAVRSFKTGGWRVHAALLVLLAVLTVGQLGYLHYQSNTVSVTCVSRVVEVPDDYHVVIETWQGNVVLESVPAVTALLETDGTEYVFTYRSHKKDPLEGKLSYASQIDD